MKRKCSEGKVEQWLTKRRPNVDQKMIKNICRPPQSGGLPFYLCLDKSSKTLNSKTMSIEERMNDASSIEVFHASEEECAKAEKEAEEHIVQAMEKLLKEEYTDA